MNTPKETDLLVAAARIILDETPVEDEGRIVFLKAQILSNATQMGLKSVTAAICVLAQSAAGGLAGDAELVGKRVKPS